MRPYFARIDSLRILGAACVAVYHFAGWHVQGVPLLPPASLEYIPGHAALLMFFVISGFVLRVALDHGPTNVVAATKKFLIGRVFRVYPIVFAGVGLALLFPLCRVGVGTMDPIRNLLLLDVTANPTLWALQVEMLMVPIILLAWRLERATSPRVLLILAVIASGLACEPKWAVWPPLSRNLFAFLLGMVLPVYGPGFASQLSKSAVLVAALAAWFSQPILGIYSHVGGIIQGYAAFVVVSYAVYRPDRSQWLDTPWLIHLGRAAGSFYVLHMATLQATILFAEAVLPSMSPVLGPVVLLTWLAVMSGISLAGYHLIELPGITLGKRISKRVGQASRLPHEQSRNQPAIVPKHAA